MNRFILMIFIFCIIINIKSFAQKRRDPFVSLKDRTQVERNGRVKLPYPIKLEGIMCSKEAALAILNGEIVKEGEKWREFKIEKIEKDRVILSWGDKKITIFSTPEKEK